MSAGSRKRHSSVKSMDLRSRSRDGKTMCLTKQRFANWAAVELAKETMQGRVRGYRCPICHGLHITSKGV